MEVRHCYTRHDSFCNRCVPASRTALSINEKMRAGSAEIQCTYYVFTKSTMIERDLELHRQYRHNCLVVWSVTTCDEKIRRIVEPGTPPASRIFKVIKKFAEAGL